MFQPLGAVAVLLVCAITASAQTPVQDWNNVKTVPVGTGVRVVVGSRRVDGQVQSVSDDSLAIKSRKGQHMFTRPEVMRVSVSKRGHRTRNTLLGLAIGTGAGLGIGLAIGRAHDCSQGFLCGITAAYGLLLGGAIGLVGGTIAGLVIHTGGWREVYKQ